MYIALLFNFQLNEVLMIYIVLTATCSAIRYLIYEILFFALCINLLLNIALILYLLYYYNRCLLCLDLFSNLLLLISKTQQEVTHYYMNLKISSKV